MSTFRSTDLVEVGATLWVKGAPDEAVIDGLAAGGTVWLIDTDVDRSTGEVRGRAFHCVRQTGRELRWRTLTEDQVAQPDPVNAATARSLVRAMARELGTGCACALRKSMFTSDEARTLDALNRLFGVVL